ncbi:MAG: hypothetical protein WKG07_32850 [Hymenobacter sp.]
MVDQYFTGARNLHPGLGLDGLPGKRCSSTSTAISRKAPSAGRNARRGRRVPVAAQGRGAYVQPRNGASAAARYPHRATTRPTRSTHGC